MTFNLAAVGFLSSFMVISASDAIPDSAGWIKPVVDLGAAAILAWALYYVVCRHIPNLLKLNSTELDNQRVKYHEQLREQRDSYIAELKSQRESFTTAVSSIMDSSDQSRQRGHDDMQSLADALGKLTANCSAVHEHMRDITLSRQ